MIRGKSMLFACSNCILLFKTETCTHYDAIESKKMKLLNSESVCVGAQCTYILMSALLGKGNAYCEASECYAFRCGNQCCAGTVKDVFIKDNKSIRFLPSELNHLYHLPSVNSLGVETTIASQPSQRTLENDNSFDNDYDSWTKPQPGRTSYMDGFRARKGAKDYETNPHHYNRSSVGGILNWRRGF